jgi:hypothetical protein
MNFSEYDANSIVSNSGHFGGDGKEFGSVSDRPENPPRVLKPP